MGIKKFLTTLGIGAGAMYLFDPTEGSRRRASIQNQIGHVQREAQDLWSKGAQDLQNRAQGVQARNWSAVRGNSTAGQQGESGDWSPGIRLLALGGGSGLVLFGLLKGGFFGSLIRLLGFALFLRGALNKRLMGLVSRDEAEAIEFRKGLYVKAPVEEVFEFWTNYDNFPHIMSHLISVQDLGNGMSHWMAEGPAGSRVEWDATLTELVPHQVLAWESRPGSQVYNAGRVRFVPEGEGTRLDISMRYSPPGGVTGHAVASLFKTDPKSAMDDDLLRLKTLLEEGKTTVNGQQMRVDDLPVQPSTTASPYDPDLGYGSNGAEPLYDEMSKGKGRVQGQEQQAESGMPGGGQGRIDEVGPTGVYPASGPLPEGDAEVQDMASWGQGERGAAGYEDSGQSELSMGSDLEQD